MKRLLCLLMIVTLSAPLFAEGSLSNQDVVKMVAAGLGDDVTIAKIREAPQVDFKLEVDDLVSLKKDGVSQHVVQAMLDRSRHVQEPPQTPMAEGLGMDLATVSLKSSEGAMPLKIVRGTMSSAGFMGWGSLFMNYPGLHARVRIHDKHPVLLVKSSTPVSGTRNFIGKLDVDSKNDVRSLKVSSGRQGLKAAFGSSIGVISPDPDWTVSFDAVEDSAGVWKVTPKKDLEPGEYGWYIDFGAGLQAAGLFDFGID